jgi:tetratricopeptide (TPR) repeat protein
VKIDPASARAQYAVATAQVGLGNRRAAIDALNEVLRLSPKMLAAQVLMSRMQLATGNADSAVQYATLARSTQPGNVDAQLALVNGQLAKGRVPDATAAIAQLVAQYPQLAAVQLANGKILFARNDLTGARTAFTRALENNSTRTEALEALLRLDARQKTLPAAVTRIEQYSAKDPKNPVLRYLAAQTYAASGDQAKTEQTLRQVIDLAPDTMEAYVALGRLYVTQKKLDEARTEFDHAAARRPNEVAPATMAAMILQMQDKPEDARKRYEAIVTQSQQRAPIAANNLAWIYAESGQNLDTALQLAQTAKAQLPDLPQVDDTLGWIYVKKNLPDLALPSLEASAARDPKNAQYQYHLGVAYAKKGDIPKARAALERAIALQPNSADATAAQKALQDLKG